MKRCLPVCLLLFSFSAYGALSRWVDANGEVHYSDEPPPANVTAKKLSIPSAASDVPAQKSYVEREAELRKAQKSKEEAGQKAAKQKEETLSRQNRCAALRTNLATLEKGPGIVTYNDKGERIIMDDAVRKQKTESARKEIGDNCNY